MVDIQNIKIPEKLYGTKYGGQHLTAGWAPGLFYSAKDPNSALPPAEHFILSQRPCCLGLPTIGKAALFFLAIVAPQIMKSSPRGQIWWHIIGPIIISEIRTILFINLTLGSSNDLYWDCLEKTEFSLVIGSLQKDGIVLLRQLFPIFVLIFDLLFLKQVSTQFNIQTLGTFMETR